MLPDRFGALGYTEKGSRGYPASNLSSRSASSREEKSLAE